MLAKKHALWKIVFKHLPSTLQTLFLSTKKEKKHLLPSILSKDRSSWKTWPNLSWNLKRYWENIIHYAQVMEVRPRSLVSGLTCLSLSCTEFHFDFEIFMKSIFCKGKSNLAWVKDEKKRKFPVIVLASVTQQASQTHRWPPQQISYQALMSLVSINGAWWSSTVINGRVRKPFDFYLKYDLVPSRFNS